MLLLKTIPERERKAISLHDNYSMTRKLFFMYLQNIPVYTEVSKNYLNISQSNP